MIDGDGRPAGAAKSEAFLFPTAFAQQRLWFFVQLHPGSAVYHLSTVLTFDGPLDRQALEDSLVGLLDRHEALRTTFAGVDGVPVQLIAPSLHIDLPLVDVSQPLMDVGQLRADCLGRARAHHAALQAAPFDLV